MNKPKSVVSSRIAGRILARLAVMALWILAAQYDSCWAVNRSGLDASGYSRLPVNSPCADEEQCCPPGASAPDGNEDCGDCGPCPIDGMPRWYVTEPEANIFLRDRPWAYKPSRGPEVSVTLLYEMQWLDVDRPERTDTNVMTLGRQWNLGWTRYVQVATAGDTNGTYFNGSGKAAAITAGSSYDYQNQSRWVYTNSQFILYRSNGSKEYYAKQQSGVDPFVPSARVRFFVTKSEDIAGNALTFNYVTVTNSGNVSLRLSTVVDANGNTSTLAYTSSPRYASLVSSISSPFGQSVSFYYTNYTIIVGSVTNQESSLSKVVDAAGIDTRFEYDSDGDLAAMRTPYGKTVFDLRLSSAQTVARVVEPNGAQHLYMYASSFDTALIPNSISDGPPSTINGVHFSIANTFANTDLNLRNSLYWGPRQVPLLSADAYAVVTNGGFDLKSWLDTGDIAIARLQHWLALSPGGHPSTTLAVRKGHAPATGVEGQWTWYDHEGKTDSETVGSMSWPSLIGQKLPNGEAQFTQFVRDSSGNVLQEKSTYSDAGTVKLRTTSFGYGTNGFSLLAVTNALGKTVFSATYNSQNLPTAITNALGETTTYAYNANGQVTSVALPTGLVTTSFYLTNGTYSGWLASNVLHEVRGATNFYYATNKFSYGSGYLTSWVDTRGISIKFARDGLFRLTGVEYGDGTTVSNRYTVGTNPYSNSSGGLTLLDATETKDRLGNWTYYTYNSKRQPLTRTVSVNGTNAVTQWSYCDCGALTTIQNAVGDQVTFSYDQKGRRTAVNLPGSVTQSFGYDTANRLISVTDNSAAISLVLNNQGLVTESSNPVGIISTSQFDILDRTTVATDGNGVSISATYDDLNRPLTKAFSGGGTETFTYQSRGLSNYVDALGNKYLMSYDALGRLVAETNPNSEVTKFGFNTYGDLATLTDGKNQVTTWNYDSYGRLINKVDALGSNVFQLTYNGYSQVSSRWAPKDGGVTASYAFNNLGWVTNVTYTTAPTVSYRYDLLGRVTSMSDGVGTTAYAYQNGQLVSEDGPWADDTVTYSYTNRRRTALSLGQPGTTPWVQTYSWDNFNRLTTTATDAGSFGYQYYTNLNGVTAGFGGLVQKLTLPTAAFVTNSFDALGRMGFTKLYQSTNALDSHTYTYNNRNETTKKTRLDGSFVDYTYDPIGQLKTALGKELGGSTSRLNEQFQYGYDAAGNVSSKNNNALVQTFTSDSRNQLSSIALSGSLTVSGTTTSSATNVTVNGTTANRYADATFALASVSLPVSNQTFTAIASDASGRKDTNSVTLTLPTPVSFSHDQDGNLTGDGKRTLSYDDLDQLVTVVVTNGVGSSTKSQFQYDGNRRRRKRTESVWSGSAWVTSQIVRYVYDGNLVVQERDDANQPLVSYTRGLDLSGGLQQAGGIGGLLARSEQTVSGPKHTYFHGDRLGNVTTLLDSGNRISARYLYDPYGNLLSGYGPMAESNLYRYSSKEYHVASGLSYYLYRYYDPNLQRWINRDPIGESGGRNSFAYSDGDPVNLTDPFGLCSKWYDPTTWLEPDLPRGWKEGEDGSMASTPLDRVGEDNVNTKHCGYFRMQIGADAAHEAADLVEDIGEETLDGTLGVAAGYGLGKVAGKVGLKRGPVASTVAPAKRVSGTTVLGHYPAYVKMADKLGHRRFDIPKKIWDKMTEAERWAANERFLDRTIARGDDILLATPLDKIKPGDSHFLKELQYLVDKKYIPSADGTRMIPAGGL